jgi:hypothetical protein
VGGGVGRRGQTSARCGLRPSRPRKRRVRRTRTHTHTYRRSPSTREL